MARRTAEIRTRYDAGLTQIRRGMDQLWELYRELEEEDAQESLRATLLKLLHDLDETLLRETEPPPTLDPDTEESASGQPISPHLEASTVATEPEAGG